MAALRCPTCKRDVLPRAQNPAYPFCSPRCRAVDLGKWLGEEFRIASHSVEEDEDGDSIHTGSPDTDPDENVH